MIAAALLLLAAAAPPPAGRTPTSAPTPAACAAAIRHGDRARVDARCWRVGPLAIGMSRAQAQAALGEPAGDYDIDGALTKGPATLHDEVYVFPADLAARLAAHPVAAVDFQLLELTFDADRLVRISNAPGAKVSAPRCAAGPASTRPTTVDRRAFAAFQSVAGVHVGEDMRRVRRTFGRPDSVNRPGDFLNYAPAPLTLDSYDGRRLSGFAVAVDADTNVQGAAPAIALDLDPHTCRTRGFHITGPGV